jgi:hypothetical protein
MFRRPIKGLLNYAALQESGCRPPDSSAIHWRMLQSCRKMSKGVGRFYPQEEGKQRMGSSDSKRVKGLEVPMGEQRKAVRVWMLGGFRVSVGSRIITQDAWRLKKAAALVKLLALAPGHRLHREQAMDVLWPDSGRRAASNSLRKTLHAARRIFDPAVGIRTQYSKTKRSLCVQVVTLR